MAGKRLAVLADPWGGSAGVSLGTPAGAHPALRCLGFVSPVEDMVRSEMALAGVYRCHRCWPVLCPLVVVGLLDIFN